MKKTKVLFVCLGNICRSPMAEGLFIDLINKKDIANNFLVDSAGTYGGHAGEKADSRMRKTAKKYGVNLPSRSRKVQAEDFEKFDYIIAMDRSNFLNLESMKPSDSQSTLLIMRQFDVEKSSDDVFDPYYGGIDGFEDVYHLLKICNENFLDYLLSKN